MSAIATRNSSLPTEIISLILGSAPTTGDECVCFAIKAASISRHWRVVALETPTLWATFDFSLRHHRNVFLRTFATRSKSSLLTMGIDVDLEDPGEVIDMKVQQAIQFIRKSAVRTRSLYFRVTGDWAGSYSFMTSFGDYRSDTLEHFSMDIHEGTRTVNYNRDVFQDRIRASWWGLYKSCPQFSRLYTTDIGWVTFAPTRLTTIHIRNLTSSLHFTYDTLSAFLRQARDLQELVIHGEMPEEIGEIGDDVEIPSLRSLTLQGSTTDHRLSGHDQQVMADLLEALVTPGLQSLALPDHVDVDRQIWMYHSQVWPELTQLTISSCLWFFWTLLLPPQLPRLSALTLVTADLGEVAVSLTVYAGRNFLSSCWTQLDVLDLRAVINTSVNRKEMSQFVSGLASLLHARQQLGKPQMTVYLPRGIDPSRFPLEVLELAMLHAHETLS